MENSWSKESQQFQLQGFPAFNQLTGVGDLSQSVQRQVFIDPETIKNQLANAISFIDRQISLYKDRSKTEYESQKQAIGMKAEHEVGMVVASIEQSKQQSLFALDQQHQQRILEIEQRAQEQRMQIEATASQLILQSQQQRLQREMQEKLMKLQQSMPQSSNVSLFSTQPNIPSSYAGAGGNNTGLSNAIANGLFNVPSLYVPMTSAASTSPSAKNN